MENNRDDLVVILAGYKDRMDTFFRSNPGIRSRVAHHIDFPDYTDDELLSIGEADAGSWNYTLRPRAKQALPTTSGAAARSRISPTRARFATRSIAPGCGMPIACFAANGRRSASRS